MPPNLHAMVGEELREWLHDFVDRYSVEYLKLTHDETVMEGSLAFRRFVYGWKVTPKAAGETKAIVHGALGSDPLGCVTRIAQRAATKMTVAKFLSRQ